MLEDISNETYGNENLLQQKLKLQDRRQRLIDAAKQAQAQAGTLGRGQMVSGHYVRAPKLAPFIPIAQQLLSHVEDRAIDEHNARLDRRITKAQAEHLQAYPGPDADTQATLQWSMKGAQIPGMQSVMEKFLQDRLVAAPEREAARKSKAEQVAETLAQRAEQAQKDREARAESDRIRSEDRRYQTDQNVGLRRALAGAMAARGGSGRTGATLPDTGEGSGWKTVKNPAGKDIISKDNEDGTTTLVYKPTGETLTIPGQISRPSAGVTADKLTKEQKVRNAQEGLLLLENADKLLKTATGSGAGALMDKAAAFFGGSTDGADAAAQMGKLGNDLTAMLDRMPGQVSDADLKFLKARIGNLDDPSVPTSQKKAVVKDLKDGFARILRNARGEASGPSIREAVESAAKQQGSKSIDDLLNKYK